MAEALIKIDNGTCHICHEETENLSANPSRWPIWLPYVGGNGKTRPYHTQCVVLGLQIAKDTVCAVNKWKLRGHPDPKDILHD